MAEIGIISGSGFYDFPDLEGVEDRVLETRFGPAPVRLGVFSGRGIAFIARHGRDHRILPNRINYRANLSALKSLGCSALVATTICGVCEPTLPLAVPVVFEDLYFPENRLPNGEICSIFDTVGQRERGHYLFANPFSADLRSQLIRAGSGTGVLAEGVYAQVNGPRFSTAAEVKALRSFAQFISQTAGPEIVLAGELEIPCALLGFGVDYANSVSTQPTPPAMLNDNMKKSRTVFLTILKKTIKNFKTPAFDGFIYRFE